MVTRRFPACDMSVRRETPPCPAVRRVIRISLVNSVGKLDLCSCFGSDFLLILTGVAESEDLSSGDYSEPTTPNRKTFPNISDEIYQHYHLLQLKLDTHFKQREFERSCASNRSKSPANPLQPLFIAWFRSFQVSDWATAAASAAARSIHPHSCCTMNSYPQRNWNRI